MIFVPNVFIESALWIYRYINSMTEYLGFIDNLIDWVLCTETQVRMFCWSDYVVGSGATNDCTGWWNVEKRWPLKALWETNVYFATLLNIVFMWRYSQFYIVYCQ